MIFILKKGDIMISKSQKSSLILLGIVAFILSVVVLIPFKVVANQVSSLEWLVDFEKMLKFIIIPVIVILLTVYPMILKHKGYKTKKYLSVGNLKMTYFLGVNYILALFTYSLGVLAAANKLNGKMGSIVLAGSAAAMIVLYLLFALIPGWLKLLSKKISYVIDAIFVLGFIGVIIVLNYCLTKVQGTPVLETEFVLLVVGAVGIILGIYFVLVVGSLQANCQVKVVLSQNEKLAETEKIAEIREEEAQKIVNAFQEYYEKSSGIFLIGLEKNKDAN